VRIIDENENGVCRRQEFKPAFFFFLLLTRRSLYELRVFDGKMVNQVHELLPASPANKTVISFKQFNLGIGTFINSALIF
jgi:hypothetical protein